MDFLSIGAAKFAFEAHGSGPHVVLLHPGVGDHRVWSETTKLLPEYRTLAYDRRGFGFTESPPEPHSWVGDLLSILDARDIRQAVLVGNSQGGRVAIDAALAHPDRVAGLVLFGSAVSGAPWPEPTGEVRKLADDIEAAERRDDLDDLNRLEAHLWLDGPKSAEGRVSGRARELFLDMNGRALRAGEVGEALSSPSAWDRLSQVPVPTLVIFGDLDVAPLRHISRTVAEQIPNAVYRELRGLAHVPQLEDPLLCAQIIRDFLGSCPEREGDEFVRTLDGGSKPGLA